MATKTKTKKKKFDTVEFFRSIKQRIAEKLSSMTLAEQKEFLRLIREGKVMLT